MHAIEYLQRRRENDPEDRLEVVLDNNFLKLMKSIKPQILRSFICVDQDKRRHTHTHTHTTECQHIRGKILKKKQRQISKVAKQQ